MSGFEAYIEGWKASCLAMADQPYEVGAEAYREAAAREELWCEEMRRDWERKVLKPCMDAWVDAYLDTEAAKAARPPIGKPLSLRARRRNRGRVRTAKVALSRQYRQPIRWTWNTASGLVRGGRA